MSQRGSRATRHSVYTDEGDDGDDNNNNVKELRDSNAVVVVASTKPKSPNYGSHSSATNPEASTIAENTTDNNNDNKNNEDERNLTWRDKQGNLYRYFADPLISVCPFILCQELCERLAYYGLTPTLKPFLKTTLHVGDAEASSLMGWFQGFLYLTPVVSAAMADSFLGVYNTILSFSVIYAAGLALIVFAAIESISSPWMVYVSLFVLICIGAGGIKSCVNVFGAQQFHPTAQKERITTFFSYFYASINVGSLIGGIACPQVQHDVSFFAAYLIPFSSFVVSCGVFISGTARYLRFKPQGSPVVGVAKVLISAAKARSFDACKKSNGGDQDDDFVADTLQLLYLQPVCALVVPMLIAYNQMTTAFLTQGEKMSHKLFGADFAPAMMQNVDAFSVIATSLFVEKVLYPSLRRRGWMPSVIARFAIGNAITVFALLFAYVVELEVMTQRRPNSVSIWAQIPQFALIAVAEIFTVSTSYEVAFTMAPLRLKAVASACNLLWFSAAGFISGFLFIACSAWMPDFDAHDYSTYQESHYDYYYLVLAGVCCIGVVFCMTLRGYFQRVATMQRGGLPAGETETEEQKHTIVVSDAKLGSEEAALLENC